MDDPVYQTLMELLNEDNNNYNNNNNNNNGSEPISVITPISHVEEKKVSSHNWRQSSDLLEREDDNDEAMDKILDEIVSFCDSDETNYLINNTSLSPSSSASSTSSFSSEKDEVQEPRLCYICHEKAGKHIYYGGQCCPSCRAFFRRSVQNNYYELFFCTLGNGNCAINVRTRKCCQYCRFQKCLKAGMKASWVLPDGERNLKKLQALKSNQQYKRQKEQRQCLVDVPRQITTSPAAIPSKGLSRKEILLIEGLKSRFFKNIMNSFEKMIRRNSGFVFDFFEFLRNPESSTSINLNAFLNINAEDFANICMVDEATKLSENDRRMIYQHNFPIVKVFRQACILNFDGCPTMDEAIESLKIMNLRDEIMKVWPPSIRFNLKHVLPNVDWSSQDEYNRRYIECFRKMTEWSLDGCRVKDEVMTLLMILILFFNSDFIQRLLDEPNVIEEIRLKYVLMLRRYLIQKNPKRAMNNFTQGLMINSLAREALELSEKLDNFREITHL